MAGPKIILGMLDGMVDHLFTAEQLARLDAVGDIIDRVPFSTFDDDRSTAALHEAEILVGHWGCPTLAAEVMARAPRLRLFA
ncbi:MAG: hydroxyacid dehydrogenase, partial [Acidimicrobiia bacterium]|nr:hydroxyacid dehydrogenase [Acidimicrobiia bacterium]